MVTGVGIDRLLADAREGLTRVPPDELAARQRDGAFVVDVRPSETRTVEAHIPGAVVIDRLVLEWRLDPTSGASIPDGPGLDDEVIVVCNEGYASSLAARDLQRLGFHRATDLVGGFRAYAAAGGQVQKEPTCVATAVPTTVEANT